ncbi:MAG: VWA domain-containing protein, partial [Pseudomonadota bacterium]
MRVFASISLAFGLMASTAALAAERTIIVLDASGSMWGQIDGTAKISIAREALGGVVADLDPAREVGLMAYGHRQKGQCSDIELMVEPQANFADRILDTVAGVKPKGKTPLSDAVRQAAEALKYTEDKATVILITDGLETCNADPCALGKALEESGVDFTAHVVGFGLTDAESREVACLAEETGGLYLSAADGTELVEALDQTVVAETQPAPAQQEEEPEPVPEATLTAPDEAEIAAVVDVVWEGPGEKYDRIEIFDPNSGPDGKAVRRISLNGPGYDQNTVAMTLPATEGDYVLRYFSGTHRQVIGTRPISVVPVDVALFAPETISMGKTLNVEWIGPGAKYDAVVIFDPNAGPNGKKVRDGRLQNSTFDDKLVSMPAPAKPGMYELQYFSGQDRKVLATRMIEVTEAVVQMTAEEPMSAGKPIIVDWIGPGAKYDSILLWDPNAGPDGKKLKDVRLSSGDYANQRVTISGPAKAGSYELRYYNGDNRAVLATEIIEVAETVVSLTPEGALETGKNFKVAWEGPGARYDEVRLFDPNSGPDGKRIQSKRLNAGDYDNQTVTLPGPPKPGTYELRYYNG